MSKLPDVDEKRARSPDCEELLDDEDEESGEDVDEELDGTEEEDECCSLDTQPKLLPSQDVDLEAVRRLLDEGRSVNEVTEDGESLLSLACSSGYYELAQLLLATRANVEDRGLKETTPLMEAASNGHDDIVRLLLEHGGDVNAQTLQGNTPLMYACASGHEQVVATLLAAGANVEDHNENGHTPLMEAASAGHVGVARMLVEHGASINTHSNEFKESALTLACYKGHLEMVRFLLEAGADQEHKTEEMHTALMEASMDGHVEVARLLLDSGAQVNMPADSFESPLTLAACGGHVELALLLLERGANLEEVNDEGYTPLMEAAREGHEEMVALLLAQGADINAQTEETQETALTLACCGGFLEVADFLIKAGADIEAGANTPLMEAAQEGHIELVRHLISCSANVNATTGSGDTSLMYACENGHTDVAEVLLEHGAVLEHEAEGGRTPLMKAARAGHLGTVQFLVQNGASVNKVTTNNDHTPLSLACAGGHQPVVEYLLNSGADPTHRLKDNSTMLIEAAKGGHTHVVQLLIEYPNRSSPTPHHRDLSCAPCDSTGPDQPLAAPPPPRVPPHGAEASFDPQNVAAQQPVQTAIRTGGAPSVTKAVPKKARTGKSATNGANNNANLPTALSKQINESSNQPQVEPYVPQPKGRAANQALSAKAAQLERSLSDSGVPGADLNVLTAPKRGDLTRLMTAVAAASGASPANTVAALKETERLEQCINNMMKRTEMLNPSREEQILQKQQILEELQRVEKELQEKAQAQMLLTQHSHQQPTAAVAPGQQVIQALANATADLTLGTGDVASPPSLAHAASGTAQPTMADSSAQTTADWQHQQQASTAAHDLSLDGGDAAKMQQASSPGSNKAIGKNRTVAPNTGRVIAKPSKTRAGAQAAAAKKELLEVEKKNLRNIAEVMGPTIQGVNPSVTVVGQSLTRPPPAGQEASTAAAASTQQQQPPPGSFLLQEFNALAARTQSQANHETLSLLYQHVFDNATGSLAAPNATAVATQATAQQVNDQPNVSANIKAAVSSTTTPNLPKLSPTQLHLLKNQLAAAAQATLAGKQIGNTSTCALAAAAAAMVAPGSPSLTDAATNTAAMTDIGPPVFPVQLNLSQDEQQRYLQATGAAAAAAIDPHHQYATHGFGLGETMPIDGQDTGAVVGSLSSSSVATTVSTTTNTTSSSSVPSPPPLSWIPPVDLDSQTESNHDTALTLACSGGHEELVALLLARGANHEHRDKKGFTPLMLAATAGHAGTCEYLLNHGADIEAQSERTKDTALSLACSSGRYEVVELLLSRNANKEHRNVSDYTPLSLAASGGYVDIIKLLLQHNAEINSRTGSKLGISPLMLAAMNGHASTVKLLLDMGSDINAQIETNRNTALTLACFQGRCEVVSLLLERKANVEHRAKTGLTPLMEAASGGYVEVGRILLDKGADVNASPVPSSRDTALTIAADKGHYRFVELLIRRGAQVDVKNKKGSSPLWLAANGGHLEVVQLLVNNNADIDSQDNRKVSCLMAAFRKGHLKVVKWMVKHVSQFPSDQEMTRYMALLSDKELVKKCQQCVDIIKMAKEKQAAEASKNATLLLEEIESEKNREESRKQAAARKREKKKAKRAKKQEASKTPATTTDKDKGDAKNQKKKDSDSESESSESDDEDTADTPATDASRLKADADSSKTVTSTSASGSSSARSSQSPAKEALATVKGRNVPSNATAPAKPEPVSITISTSNQTPAKSKKGKGKGSTITATTTATSVSNHNHQEASAAAIEVTNKVEPKTSPAAKPSKPKVEERVPSPPFVPPPIQTVTAGARKNTAITTADDFLSDDFNGDSKAAIKGRQSAKKGTAAAAKGPSTGDAGWREVQANRRATRKVVVPASAISRVIGRQGFNINEVRRISGAHIEVEKQKSQQGDRQIIIKGTAQAMTNAQQMISALVNEPDKEVAQIAEDLGLSQPTLTSEDEFAQMPNTPIRSASSKQANVQPAVSVSKSASATLATKQPSKSAAAVAAGQAAPKQVVTATAAAANQQQSPLFQGNTWLATKGTAVPTNRITTAQAGSTAAQLTSTSANPRSRSSAQPPPLSAATASISPGIAKAKSMVDPKQQPLGVAVRGQGQGPPSQPPFASRSPKPPAQPVESMPPSSKEYTPFKPSTLFDSPVNVWKRPNFASVAAIGISGQSEQVQPIGPGHHHLNESHRETTVSVEEPDVAAKAPGYRPGNFISPAAPSSVQPSTGGYNQLMAQPMGQHRSAPCTPPLLLAANAPNPARQPTPPNALQLQKEQFHVRDLIQTASHTPPVSSQHLGQPLTATSLGGTGIVGQNSISRTHEQFDQPSASAVSSIFSSSSPFVNSTPSYHQPSATKSFNLAPGARTSSAVTGSFDLRNDLRSNPTSTIFSQQHGGISSVGPIHPPSNIDSVMSSFVTSAPGSGVSHSVFSQSGQPISSSGLNPNAPDFSTSSAGARPIHGSQSMSNGGGLLRPQPMQQQQLQSQMGASNAHSAGLNARPQMPYNDNVLPNPLQLQMRAAILAAGASLQMQTLQQQAQQQAAQQKPHLAPQQARHSSFNPISLAQAQAATILGAPDFSPPTPETLQLLHTAISSLPSAGVSTSLHQPPGSGQMGNQGAYGNQYGLGPMRAQKNAAEADDDRKPLGLPRPIGTERAQKNSPYTNTPLDLGWPVTTGDGTYNSEENKWAFNATSTEPEPQIGDFNEPTTLPFPNSRYMYFP